MSHELITVKNLSIGYANQPLCNDVNFSLNAGDWYALTGRNGIGKTTLLRCLCGLLQPLSGEVIHQSLTSTSSMASDVLYVGHLSGLKSELTVRENLSFYITLENKSIDMIDQYAKKMQITSILDQSCNSISQGQLHRASLCRLAITNRRIWLLDEPTTALDKDGVSCLTQLLVQHLSNGGSALIATHNKLTIPDYPSKGELQLNAHA